METVGSYEAKTHLPRLLKKVEDGAVITITKHGVPIARLVPAGGGPLGSPQAAVDKIRELRKQVKPGPKIDIKAAIEEGRM
jgi:prevent-host-death family protein